MKISKIECTRKWVLNILLFEKRNLLLLTVSLLLTGFIHLTFGFQVRAEEPVVRLTGVAAWFSSQDETAFEIAWADFDNDFDLDLAVGTPHGPRVYYNEGAMLQDIAAWSVQTEARARSVAWGDMDSDGDLDLVVGYDAGANKIYRNEASVLQKRPFWTASQEDETFAIALGDFDGDADLDLAVGNQDEPAGIYINHGLDDQGNLRLTPGWTSPHPAPTDSIALGDMDGDGTLDLVLGNQGGSQDQIYLNKGWTDSDQLQLVLGWSAPDSDHTTSVALEDADGDGDLDLAVGQSTGSNKVYLNQGLMFQTRLQMEAVLIPGADTYAVAWGDLDTDGDFDLLLGNWGSPNMLYQNKGLTTEGTLQFGPAWSDEARSNTLALALGDVDGDGDLDLAEGNQDNPLQLYLDDGISLQPRATEGLQANFSTNREAWADFDGDGDLDVAIGRDGRANQIYRNNRGTFDLYWDSGDEDRTRSIAWGDVDGDGDLDLAAANIAPEPGGDWVGAPNKIYRNEGGPKKFQLFWRSTESDVTATIAWGDVDADGDLDLAAGNSTTPSKLYLNDGGALQESAAWASSHGYRTRGIAWGDIDSDGDLDLVTGDFESSNKVYFNQEGILQKTPGWRSADNDDTVGIALGDVDGDGDLDLAAVNNEAPAKVYLNDRGSLQSVAAWISADELPDVTDVTWVDGDWDGNLDLAIKSMGKHQTYFNRGPAYPAHPHHYPTITIDDVGSMDEDFRVPVTYTLFHPTGANVQSIRVFFSPDGGGQWQTAVAAGETITKNLATVPQGTTDNTHLFLWDVLKSGFFGKSEAAVLRIEAYLSVAPEENGVAGPYQQRPYVAAQSEPFRLRGTQVEVNNEDGENVSNAIIYQLPDHRTKGAMPLAGGSGRPFRTDQQGFLQGRGRLAISDTLVALLPVSDTEAYPASLVPTRVYSVYYTSAQPNETGLAAAPIEELGLQRLTISRDNRLTLFNLDVALEWDARHDEAFMSQLTFDLRRTSELLYDWTNGQAALGQVTVAHYIQNDPDGWVSPDIRIPRSWVEADIRIYANNRLRPNATIGGVVAAATADPDRPQVRYWPGQVRMGTVWNRFGESGNALGDDWPRALAHELGHYLFFLSDHYLGFKADDRHFSDVIVPISGCFGAMSDPYRNDYSEFNSPEQWQDTACAQTVTYHEEGGAHRSDWEKLNNFYPWLEHKEKNNGPSTLPLAVTQVTFVSHITPTQAIEVPIFYISTEGRRDSGEALPGPNAQAFLFQENRLIDLGGPIQDRILAHGARPGDELCLYDLEGAIPRLGCEIITRGDDQLTIFNKPDWKPDLIVSPVSSQTIKIEVPAGPYGPQATDKVQARLYPANFEATPVITLELEESGNLFRGEFDLAYPAVEAAIRVWVTEELGGETRREAVTNFGLGGSPVPPQIGGLRQYRWYAPTQMGGVSIQIGGVPMISTDGQVTLFSNELNFQPGEFYTLQAATSLPDIPAWSTPVGQGYRLIKSDNRLDLSKASISFRYLERQVPPGEESWLSIYYWNGQSWEKLETQLDTDVNLAAARARDEGLYALMTSLVIPLEPGWNLFAYPIRETRAVKEALSSIEGRYTLVCGYDPGSGQWAVYEPDGEQTLTRLEFGQGYWIKAMEATALQLRGASTQAEESDLPAPTYSQSSKCSPASDSAGVK